MADLSEELIKLIKEGHARTDAKLDSLKEDFIEVKAAVKTHDDEIQKLRSFKNIFLPIVGLAQALSVGIGMWLESKIKGN